MFRCNGIQYGHKHPGTSSPELHGDLLHCGFKCHNILHNSFRGFNWWCIKMGLFSLASDCLDLSLKILEAVRSLPQPGVLAPRQIWAKLFVMSTTLLFVCSNQLPFPQLPKACWGSWWVGRLVKFGPELPQLEEMFFGAAFIGNRFKHI